MVWISSKSPLSFPPFRHSAPNTIPHLTSPHLLIPYYPPFSSYIPPPFSHPIQPPSPPNNALYTHSHLPPNRRRISRRQLVGVVIVIVTWLCRRVRSLRVYVRVMFRYEWGGSISYAVDGSDAVFIPRVPFCFCSHVLQPRLSANLLTPRQWCMNRDRSWQVESAMHFSPAIRAVQLRTATTKSASFFSSWMKSPSSVKQSTYRRFCSLFAFCLPRQQQHLMQHTSKITVTSTRTWIPRTSARVEGSPFDWRYQGLWVAVGVAVTRLGVVWDG